LRARWQLGKDPVDLLCEDALSGCREGAAHLHSLALLHHMSSFSLNSLLSCVYRAEEDGSGAQYVCCQPHMAAVRCIAGLQTRNMPQLRVTTFSVKEAALLNYSPIHCNNSFSLPLHNLLTQSK